MPKSLKQPDVDSEESYFTLYFKDQYSHIKAEMTRLDKRLLKMDKARELFERKFGKKSVLDMKE